MHLAIVVADRNIFSGTEGVRGEPETGLFGLFSARSLGSLGAPGVLSGGGAVVEDPTPVLGTAGLVDEPAELLGVAPEAADAAVFAMSFERSGSMCPVGSSGATNS